MKTYRTAKAVLIDDEGRVLLLRRSGGHPTMAHHMDLPGGIIEDDEQPVDCLMREIAEETKLDIRDNDLKLFFAMTEEFHGMNAIRQVFLAKVNGSEPQVSLSWEHDKYEWLSIDEAIKALPPQRYVTKAVKHLKEKNLLSGL